MKAGFCSVRRKTRALGSDNDLNVKAAHKPKKKKKEGCRERKAFCGEPSFYLHDSLLVIELGFEIEKINSVLSKERQS